MIVGKCTTVELSSYFLSAINCRVLLANGQTAHRCGQDLNLEVATHAAGSVLGSAVERLVPPVKKYVTEIVKHQQGSHSQLTDISGTVN